MTARRCCTEHRGCGSTAIRRLGSVNGRLEHGELGRYVQPQSPRHLVEGGQARGGVAGGLVQPQSFEVHVQAHCQLALRPASPGAGVREEKPEFVEASFTIGGTVCPSLCNLRVFHSVLVLNLVPGWAMGNTREHPEGFTINKRRTARPLVSSGCATILRRRGRG